MYFFLHHSLRPPDLLRWRAIVIAVEPPFNLRSDNEVSHSERRPAGMPGNARHVGRERHHLDASLEQAGLLVRAVVRGKVADLFRFPKEADEINSS